MHADRHHSITIAIEKLASVFSPSWLRPSVVRDLCPATKLRELTHVYFRPTGLVGRVREPSTVGRDLGGVPVDARVHQRLHRAAWLRIECPDVRSGGRIGGSADQKASVRRK